MSENENGRGNGPVDRVQDGTIQSSIFQRDGEYGPRFNATIERRWQDDQGNWHSSNSFSETETLRASKVLDRAHERMLGLRQEHSMTRDASEEEQHDGDRRERFVSKRQTCSRREVSRKR